MLTSFERADFLYDQITRTQSGREENQKANEAQTAKLKKFMYRNFETSGDIEHESL